MKLVIELLSSKAASAEVIDSILADRTPIAEIFVSLSEILFSAFSILGLNSASEREVARP